MIRAPWTPILEEADLSAFDALVAAPELPGGLGGLADEGAGLVRRIRIGPVTEQARTAARRTHLIRGPDGRLAGSRPWGDLFERPLGARGRLPEGGGHPSGVPGVPADVVALIDADIAEARLLPHGPNDSWFSAFRQNLLTNATLRDEYFRARTLPNLTLSDRITLAARRYRLHNLSSADAAQAELARQVEVNVWMRLRTEELTAWREEDPDAYARLFGAVPGDAARLEAGDLHRNLRDNPAFSEVYARLGLEGVVADVALPRETANELARTSATEVDLRQQVRDAVAAHEEPDLSQAELDAYFDGAHETRLGEMDELSRDDLAANAREAADLAAADTDQFAQDATSPSFRRAYREAIAAGEDPVGANDFARLEIRALSRSAGRGGMGELSAEEAAVEYATSRPVDPAELADESSTLNQALIDDIQRSFAEQRDGNILTAFDRDESYRLADEDMAEFHRIRSSDHPEDVQWMVDYRASLHPATAGTSSGPLAAQEYANSQRLRNQQDAALALHDDIFANWDSVRQSFYDQGIGTVDEAASNAAQELERMQQYRAAIDPDMSSLGDAFTRTYLNAIDRVGMNPAAAFEEAQAALADYRELPASDVGRHTSEEWIARQGLEIEDASARVLRDLGNRDEASIQEWARADRTWLERRLRREPTRARQFQIAREEGLSIQEAATRTFGNSTAPHVPSTSVAPTTNPGAPSPPVPPTRITLPEDEGLTNRGTPRSVSQGRAGRLMERFQSFRAGEMWGVRGGSLGGFGRAPEEVRALYAADLNDPGIVYTVGSFGTPIGWVRADGQVRHPDVTYSNRTMRHHGYVSQHLGGLPMALQPIRPPVDMADVRRIHSFSNPSRVGSGERLGNRLYGQRYFLVSEPATATSAPAYTVHEVYQLQDGSWRTGQVQTAAPEPSRARAITHVNRLLATQVGGEPVQPITISSPVLRDTGILGRPGQDDVWDYAMGRRPDLAPNRRAADTNPPPSWDPGPPHRGGDIDWFATYGQDLNNRLSVADFRRVFLDERLAGTGVREAARRADEVALRANPNFPTLRGLGAFDPAAVAEPRLRVTAPALTTQEARIAENLRRRQQELDSPPESALGRLIRQEAPATPSSGGNQRPDWLEVGGSRYDPVRAHAYHAARGQGQSQEAAIATSLAARQVAVVRLNQQIAEPYLFSSGRYQSTSPSFSQSSPQGVGQHDVHVSGSVEDAAGNEVGRYSRELSFKYGEDGWQLDHVYHGAFNMNGPHRGTGFGDDFVSHMFESYRAQGARYVDIQAVDVGAYKWAKMGFTYRDPHLLIQDSWRAGLRADLANNFDRLQLTTSERARLRALVEDILGRVDRGIRVEPREISLLGKDVRMWHKQLEGGHDAEIWYGKDFLQGRHWEGRKWLHGRPGDTG